MGGRAGDGDREGTRVAVGVGAMRVCAPLGAGRTWGGLMVAAARLLTGFRVLLQWAQGTSRRGCWGLRPPARSDAEQHGAGGRDPAEGPAPGGAGGATFLGAVSVPPSPCSCPRRAALIAWGVLSVLGGAFVCGQSAALAVLGLLR